MEAEMNDKDDMLYPFSELKGSHSSNSFEYIKSSIQYELGVIDVLMCKLRQSLDMCQSHFELVPDEDDSKEDKIKSAIMEWGKDTLKIIPDQGKVYFCYSHKELQAIEKGSNNLLFIVQHEWD